MEEETLKTFSYNVTTEGGDTRERANFKMKAQLQQGTF